MNTEWAGPLASLASRHCWLPVAAASRSRRPRGSGKTAFVVGGLMCTQLSPVDRHLGSGGVTAAEQRHHQFACTSKQALSWRMPCKCGAACTRKSFRKKLLSDPESTVRRHSLSSFCVLLLQSADQAMHHSLWDGLYPVSSVTTTGALTERAHSANLAYYHIRSHN